MSKIKKSPALLGNSIKHKPRYSNTSASQRARILKHFESNNKLSTMQARDAMGILHPCGRIMELRRLGYKIDTIWVYELDNNRVSHRIGMYIFHGTDWGAIEKRLSIRRELASLTLDKRYALLKAEISKKHLTPEQYEAENKSLCKFLNY